jgi:hypothetical protein
MLHLNPIADFSYRFLHPGLLLVKPSGDHAVLTIYKGCVRDVVVWHRNLHDPCCQGDIALRTVATWPQARYWVEPVKPPGAKSQFIERVKQRITEEKTTISDA